MGTIDADAHVLETPDSWRFMEGEDKKFVPGIFTQTFGPELKANDLKANQSNYWMVGDRTFSKDRNVGTEMSRANRETEDLPGRLAHQGRLKMNSYTWQNFRDHYLSFWLNLGHQFDQLNRCWHGILLSPVGFHQRVL